MKKRLLGTIIMFLLILTLVACGTKKEVETSTSPEVSVSVSVTEPEPEVSVEPEPVHEHEYVYTSNDDYTHTKLCKTCDEVFETSDCDMVSDYVEPEEIPEDAATIINKSNETLTCSVCGFTHKHNPEYTIADSEDGYHEMTCPDCNEVVMKEVHSLKQNADIRTCTACGYTEYVWVVKDIDEAIKYTNKTLNIREYPTKDSNLVKQVPVNTELTINGHVTEYDGEKCDYYRLTTGGYAVVSYTSDEKTVIEEKPATQPTTETPAATGAITYKCYDYNTKSYGTITFNNYDEVWNYIVSTSGFSKEIWLSDATIPTYSSAGRPFTTEYRLCAQDGPSNNYEWFSYKLKLDSYGNPCKFFAANTISFYK